MAETKQTIDLVQEFMETFEQECPKLITVFNNKLSIFRLNLLREELAELSAALIEGSPEDVLDALTDLQYVLDGAYIAFGLAKYKNAAFNEVHKSNMAKLWSDGKVHKNEHGKIIKPPGWQKPDLDKVINLCQN